MGHVTMNKDAKIYVAGHTGLVGSAVLRRFATSGYHNIVTRDFTDLDLRRQDQVENFFDTERPDYVVLAAAKVGGILANSTYKAEFIYDNLMIATNVIHAAYKFGVKRLINLGSSCIYPKNAPQPLKEEYLLTGPLEETNEPYAIAKIAAIKLCRYYNEQYGTQFISLMPTNLYGPYDNFNLETSHVLPALLRKFYFARLLTENNLEAVFADIKKTPLGWGLEKNITKLADLPAILAKLGIYADRVELWGSGEVYREFLYVDDLANVVEGALQIKDITLFNADYLINVGTGQDLPIKELARLVADQVGFKGTIVFGTSKLEGTKRKLLDVHNLNSIGIQPAYDFAAGIRKTFTWYVDNKKERAVDIELQRARRVI